MATSEEHVLSDVHMGDAVGIAIPTDGGSVKMFETRSVTVRNNPVVPPQPHASC